MRWDQAPWEGTRKVQFAATDSERKIILRPFAKVCPADKENKISGLGGFLHLAATVGGHNSRSEYGGNRVPVWLRVFFVQRGIAIEENLHGAIVSSLNGDDSGVCGNGHRCRAVLVLMHPIGMGGRLVIDPHQEIGSRNGARGFAVQNTDGDGLACLRVPGWGEECRAHNKQG